MNNSIDCNLQKEIIININDFCFIIKKKCFIIKHNEFILITKLNNKDKKYELSINENFINKYITNKNKVKVINKIDETKRKRNRVNYSVLSDINNGIQYGTGWVCQYCGENNIKGQIKQMDHFRECKKKNIIMA